MFNFSLGIMASMWIGIAGWYGYTYSLTERAFFIQGYIGAAMPVLFLLVGAGLMAAYNLYNTRAA